MVHYHHALNWITAEHDLHVAQNKDRLQSHLWFDERKHIVYVSIKESISKCTWILCKCLCFDSDFMLWCHLPSSEILLSLVSCSICWHQPSMRPVSACRSFRNQLPSRRQAGVPVWTLSPWLLPFPDSKLGSGGGNEEGSRAGSRLCGGEVDILGGAEVCLRAGCSMALSGPLGAVVFTVWLLVPLAVLFSVGAASWGSWGSVSVFCLEDMLLSRLRLQRHE